jgi:AcrR family transcriptional regulator
MARQTNALQVALLPRKTPVQARSAHTVQSIHTATIQVLLDGGLERLTTTRVAVRAGVSVGTLYQYFPNKQSLLASVLERHLLQVVEAVEAACLQAKGQAVGVMAENLVQAFFEAKFVQPEVSRALYALSAELGANAVVARLTHRSQLALCAMLATASDRRFDDLAPISFVLSTSVIGPVQALLASSAPYSVVSQVQEHVTALVSGYLLHLGHALKIEPRGG